MGHSPQRRKDENTCLSHTHTHWQWMSHNSSPTTKLPHLASLPHALNSSCQRIHPLGGFDAELRFLTLPRISGRPWLSLRARLREIGRAPCLPSSLGGVRCLHTFLCPSTPVCTRDKLGLSLGQTGLPLCKIRVFPKPESVPGTNQGRPKRYTDQKVYVHVPFLAWTAATSKQRAKRQALDKEE